jgi:hypothetical protein
MGLGFMADPSYILKLQRAREHVDSLYEESVAWIKTNPYKIVDEQDPEPIPMAAPQEAHYRRLRVTHVAEIPCRFSILIGDCVFNLRSALDHLALALASRGRRKLTDTQIATSEFPIFRKGVDFKRNESRKIGCISRAARTAIKALQPYHQRSRYFTHPLWQLNELNRIDKHRTIVVCVSISRFYGNATTNAIGADLRSIIEEYYFICASPGTIKADAVLLRWARTPVDPSQYVQLNPSPIVELAFGEGSPAEFQSIVPFLEALCDFVGDTVIAQLSTFL